MNVAPYTRRPNKVASRKMAAANAQYALSEVVIRKEQHMYVVAGRDPSARKPLTIGPGLASWLREKYKTAPKSLMLDWIASVREDHDLVACPLCGGGGVVTLDHFLPEEDYPEYAVFSFNLVPSCDPCQRRRSRKGSKFHFLHPYFDHAALSQLRCRVTFTPPYESVLFMLLPTGLRGTDLARAQKQITECLPLNQFNREMRALWRKWHYRCARDGVAATVLRLRDDLSVEERVALNSWTAAFLRSLADDQVALAWMMSNPTDI